MPRGVYDRKAKRKAKAEPKSQSVAKDMLAFVFHSMSKKELTDALLLGLLIMSEKDD